MSEYYTSLDIGEYKIIQSTEGYAFSQDSVLLANLSKIGSKDKVLELGSGSGIISMLVAIKKKPSSIVGIEINEVAADMSRRSMDMNGLADRVKIIPGDIRNVKDIVENGRFDKVICNPPYYDFEDGKSEGRNTDSKHESGATLADFVFAAAYALKFGGDFFVVMKMSRLADIIYLLRQNNLEPKNLCIVYPKPKAEADIAIISARKGAKPGLTTTTLTVMDEDGGYSEKFKELYS